MDQRAEVLGADHPEALRARDTYLWCVGESGNTGQAAAQYAKLAERLSRCSGRGTRTP